MRAVVSAFEPHRPQSRSEEQRSDAFGAMCDQLARDGFEQYDTVARKWLLDERRSEHRESIICAALSGDIAEINRTNTWVADEFVYDCREDSPYSDDARIKMQELAEAEQAANEVWR